MHVIIATITTKTFVGINVTTSTHYDTMGFYARINKSTKIKRNEMEVCLFPLAFRISFRGIEVQFQLLFEPTVVSRTPYIAVYSRIYTASLDTATAVAS